MSNVFRNLSSIFCAPTPRRRVINTAILLLLVSTIIPYQFAYMIACVVHLATCVRAQWHARETVSSSPGASLSLSLSVCVYVFSFLILMANSAPRQTTTSPTTYTPCSCSWYGFFQSTHWFSWSGPTTSWCTGSCPSPRSIISSPSCRSSSWSRPRPAEP